MEHRTNSQKIILVVDDLEDTRVLMRFLLEDLGYRVLEAENGWKAVESVKRQVPDLILMDMALPSVDGISATKLIRQFEETSKIPIIAFTASGQYVYQQAIEAGCNALLDKPIDTDKLQSMLDQYLG
ncbi:MAG: response regulator [Acidobacteriota bacterium]|nr:response regulator [Acidobacteriota bacterium]